MDSPSNRLRALVDPIWQAQHDHPFVRGIGDGSLDPARFAFWIRQDYLFLIDYCRLFALAAARSPDLETLARFADLLQATARTEMDLHRAYAAEFGLTPADLENEAKAPATQGYTDFLIRTAAAGDFVELVAALLPCMWGFYEIGCRLAERPRPADTRYNAWIEMYSGAEFGELAQWCRDLLDRLAAGLSDDAWQRVEGAFLTSSRYEWLFWESAYHQQTWPA
ncbi:MAG TPA: thiaminase II [Dehalococcoidia bacterium]|nr:thiaminase II [Dehalococcoidia bacterium]